MKIATLLLLCCWLCGCKKPEQKQELDMDMLAREIEQQVAQDLQRQLMSNPESIKGMSLHKEYAGYQSKQVSGTDIAAIRKGMNLKSVLDLCGRPMASMDTQNERLLVFCRSEPSKNSETNTYRTFPIMMINDSVAYIDWNEVDKVVFDQDSARMLSLLKQVPLCP